MAITITGGPRPENIETYTAIEDATPLDPASNTGGYGQINWTSQDWSLARRMLRTDVVLSDNERGRSTGTVRSVQRNNVVASMAADSELGKFNVVRQAMPFSGPIDDLFQYYLDLCGIFSTLQYEANVYTVHVPGFYGNVWDKVKSLLSAHQIEMALVGDHVVVRPPRQFVATNSYLTSIDDQVESQTSAVAIAINYYNNYKITKGEIYPLKTEDPTVQSVDANETIDWEVQLNASLSQVYQPVAMSEVGPGDRSGTNGAYVVVGNDNLVIPPAQWRAAGGSLRVELTSDPSTIKIVLRGAGITHLSPFRIAESAGDEDWNSLHITGDGVAWHKQTMLLNTGADPLQTSDELGTTVDNPYLSSPSQAYSAAQHTAAAYSGNQVRISGTAATINRGTHDRRQVVAQLHDADRVHALNGILTMAQFDTEYAGETLQDFDEHWRDMYRDIFQNQVYGNVNGARVKIDDAFYRIDSATINPDTIDYSASLDTTVKDFDAVWAGRTMEEFDTTWAEETLHDFSLMPLWEGTNDNPSP